MAEGKEHALSVGSTKLSSDDMYVVGIYIYILYVYCYIQ